MHQDTANAAIQQFDFRSRTLLTNILGFAELLADPHADFSPARRFECAEIVRASAAVLGERTDEFLDALQADLHSGGTG